MYISNSSIGAALTAPLELLSFRDKNEKHDDEKLESNIEVLANQKAIKISNMIRNYRDFVF